MDWEGEGEGNCGREDGVLYRVLSVVGTRTTVVVQVHYDDHPWEEEKEGEVSYAPRSDYSVPDSRSRAFNTYSKSMHNPIRNCEY